MGTGCCPVTDKRWGPLSAVAPWPWEDTSMPVRRAVRPNTSTDVVACQIGRRVMHEPVGRLTVDSGGQGEQAGSNDRSQTSFLRRLIAERGYGSGDLFFPGSGRDRKGPTLVPRRGDLARAGNEVRQPEPDAVSCLSVPRRDGGSGMVRLPQADGGQVVRPSPGGRAAGGRTGPAVWPSGRWARPRR